MFKRILIPVALNDNSDTSKVLDTAKAIGTGPKASITLLHVIETVQHIPFNELKEFYEKLEHQAEQGLRKVEEEVRARGLAVESSIVYGKRIEEIVRVAEEDSPDLVLLGSHRFKPGHVEQRWDSISHAIAILSPCPVLLVK